MTAWQFDLERHEFPPERWSWSWIQRPEFSSLGTSGTCAGSVSFRRALVYHKRLDAVRNNSAIIVIARQHETLLSSFLHECGGRRVSKWIGIVGYTIVKKVERKAGSCAYTKQHLRFENRCLDFQKGLAAFVYDMSSLAPIWHITKTSSVQFLPLTVTFRSS